MLTRLWKYAGREITNSEYILHANVISMVEFNENIFAAGNCYDKYQYKDYLLFCPYAYRLPKDHILAKNLGVEYNYFGNTSEWFFQARKNAEKVIKKKRSFSHGYNTYTWNETHHTKREADEILSVGYEDGRWSKPYYDCGGGNIWMLTYTVPFFGYKNYTYFFKGTSGIDIDLRRVDIDQCPSPEGEKSLNIFAASDKCKKATTYCVSINGLGFRRGSYKCVCQKGFYFSNKSTDHDYFDGVIIEEEYEKLMLGEKSAYNETGSFECLPCAEGCETCITSKPCVLALNWILRTTILVLSCFVIFCVLIVELFTWKYRNIKVVRAASPLLLKIISLGAIFIYSTTIVMYPTPTAITCTARIWLREIGFSLTYGALMLKTWRISVIFRIRSARKVRITDVDLIKKLGVIVLTFCVCLMIRCVFAPPKVNTVRTADELKAYLCETTLWDHWFSIMEALFLIWGIRLCIITRKAPSQYNESKFISMAIYNEFILSIFLNVSMIFLYSPANPDLLYIICFCHTQLTITLLLCFIFGSKAYMVLRGQGKGLSGENTTNIKMPTSKFLSKPTLPTTSKTFPSSSSINISGGADKLKEQEIQDEMQNICQQLEMLKEKNNRYGSKRFTFKLNSIYEYALRTLEEVSVEEESTSSNMLQEKLGDDLKVNELRISKTLTVNNVEFRQVTAQDSFNGSSADQNCCSTNPGKKKVKFKNHRQSWFKKFFLSDSDLFNDGSVKYVSSKKEVDIKPDPAQTHTIIFNIEEKSQCKQVSL